MWDALSNSIPCFLFAQSFGLLCLCIYYFRGTYLLLFKRISAGELHYPMKQTCEFMAETARTISGFIASKFRKSTTFHQKCEIIHHAPTRRRRSTAKGLNSAFKMPYPSASANNKINRKLANIYDRTKLKRKILIIYVERGTGRGIVRRCAQHATEQSK